MQTTFKHLLAGLWVGLCLPAASETAAPDTRWLKADADNFHYTGRIDFSIPGEAGLIWQASQVAIQFNGDYLAIGFSGKQGQVFFNLQIDGANQLVEANNGWLEIPVKAGEHQLTLFKRSEANAGQVRFLGVRLASDAKAKLPVVVGRPKLIFYGDSITVGANNEDGEVDQWETRRTHNSALSYAALTAEALGADHQNISVSGVGIITGFEPHPAPAIWYRMAYHPEAVPAPLAAWPADLVFVNFGENDAAFTQRNNQPFPAGYSDTYVNMVLDMRSAYPKAVIVLLRGGMSGGAKNEPLRLAWQKAVATLERDDDNIRHFVFQHWTSHHPRVIDHRLMAQELSTWVRAESLLQYKKPSL
jgi:lysophospholipase L1-like esterase